MAKFGELERRIARLEQLARQRAARTPPPRRYGHSLSLHTALQMLLSDGGDRLVDALAALSALVEPREPVELKEKGDVYEQQHQ